MNRILEIQNAHWKKNPYKNVYHRDCINVLKRKLKTREIQVLLGVRRGGKSSLFKLLINELMQKKDCKSILSINLDDPFFFNLQNDPAGLYDVVNESERITGVKPRYLFLDEVQQINRWESFVKSTYDSEMFTKTFVTGSNSGLLSGDYAKLLSGRYLKDRIYPLAFSEVLKLHKISTRLELISHHAKVLNYASSCMEYGMFPEVFFTKDEFLKRNILVDYYESILMRDCISNHSVREVQLFKTLAYYLMNNVATVCSMHSIAKSVDSNEHTVRSFVEILQSSFLFNEIRNFSWSLKANSRSKSKFYCCDNGLINTVSFRFSENKGSKLENLVFIELQKAGFDEIFFYSEHKECDFIVQGKKELKAIQVCTDLNDGNRIREISGLKAAMEQYKIKTGVIITFNQEEKISPEISVVPFWKAFSGLYDVFEFLK